MLSMKLEPSVADPSTWVTVQAVAPPVGSVEVMTLPTVSVATHRLTVGQLTPMRRFRANLPASTGVTVHEEAPPVGLVDVRTLRAPVRSLLSTATHRVTVGQ